MDEGERVKQGQLLLELDTTMKKVDKQALQTSLDIAKMEKLLLEKYLKGQDTDSIQNYIAQQNISNEIKQNLIEFTNSRKESYQTTTWKGGITRQIFISPANGDLSTRHFDLRVSSAIIDSTESDFSDFTGFTRYILPLEGDITLYKDSVQIPLSHNALYQFEGDETIHSVNTQGAVDFNIIVRHGIAVEPGIFQDTHFPTPRPRLVFALEDCMIDDLYLAKHDTALITEPFHLKGKAIVVAYS